MNRHCSGRVCFRRVLVAACAALPLFTSAWNRCTDSLLPSSFLALDPRYQLYVRSFCTWIPAVGVALLRLPLTILLVVPVLRLLAALLHEGLLVTSHRWVCRQPSRAAPPHAPSRAARGLLDWSAPLLPPARCACRSTPELGCSSPLPRRHPALVRSR